ncbi:MAG: diguanylate cyclase [Pseudomonadota bacterium]
MGRWGAPVIVLSVAMAPAVTLLIVWLRGYLPESSVVLIALAAALPAALAAAMALAIRRGLAAMRDGIEASQAAIVIYDAEDRLVFSNRAHRNMIDLDDSAMIAGSPYLKIAIAAVAHIQDRKERADELHRRLDFLARSDSTPTERSYGGGRTIRVTKTRTPLGNSIGVGMDITEAKELRADLNRRNKVFYAVAEAAPIGLLHLDASGNVGFANRAALAISQRSSAIDVGSTVFTAAHDGKTLDIPALVEASADKDVEVSVVVTDAPNPNTFIVRQAQLSGDNHKPGERVLILIDITARKAAEEQIRFFATHDPLTGAKNRMAFAETLESFSKSSERTAPTHLIAIDLDKFKPINDHYGHMVGDNILHEIVQRMTEVLEPQMTLFRMGGDEFAILCDPSKDTDLVAFCDRLLKTIEIPLPVPGSHVSVSASIGISSFPTDTDKLDSLVHYADLALYNVKDAGGGRVATYSAWSGEGRFGDDFTHEQHANGTNRRSRQADA